MCSVREMTTSRTPSSPSCDSLTASNVSWPDVSVQFLATVPEDVELESPQPTPSENFVDVLRERVIDVDTEEEPATRTIVTPLYKNRLVMLKIGDSFLRCGGGRKPVASKLKPPLYMPVNASDNDIGNALERRPAHITSPDDFRYEDFTFSIDETATIKESWFRNTRTFFNVRIGVQRQGEGGHMEYLCAWKGPNNDCDLGFDRSTVGAWWRLIALDRDKYMAESVSLPGHCLMNDVKFLGLRLSPPLTLRDRARIVKGVWDKNKTLTIITLPDFAVWKAGVVIN